MRRSPRSSCEPAASANTELRTDGSVVLAIDEVCVQTAARRAHRQLTRALLDENGDATQQQALGVLGDFLAQTDFAALRSQHPALAGGQRCRVRVHRDASGALAWELLTTG